MSTEPRESILTMLGVLVIGFGLGFTGFMLTRAETVSELVEKAQTDIHLILTSVLVIGAGVAMVWYRQGE